nr:2829_t:CDS:2 [Entrophospora candida]
MSMRLLGFIAAGIILLFNFLASAEESDVISLTKDDFSSIVKAEKVILVEFFAPWCGHCKALAATALKSDGIKLAKVDCTVENDLCSEKGVKGYPTLKLFKDGEETDYSGGRTSDSIISFMKKQTLPAITDVNVDNFETFKDSDNVVIIGFFDNDSQDEFNSFATLADRLHNEYRFGETAQPEVLAKANVTAPSVVLYKKFDDPQVVLKGPYTKAELEFFVKTNSMPLLAEIGPENYAIYAESGIPLAYLFYETPEQRSEMGKEVEPVAKEFKGKVNFVFINAGKYGQHAENLNLEAKWPAFGIQKPDEGPKFPFDQSKPITFENIREFVDKFVKGEIKPSIKSQPIPENNTEPVYVLVADSFEEVALDKSKDVLVEFYAPWCGHCKKLAPIYDELGEKYAQFKDKIVIAKMDSTANDLPSSATFKVSGFPTIKLFKAENNEVIDYSGDRSLEDFVEFLSKEAFYKVDVNKKHNMWNYKK